LEAEMLTAADELDFERAAKLRDLIERLSASIGKKVTDVEAEKTEPRGRGRRRGGKGGAHIPRPKK
jgi:excinuclease ABC subunit B